MLESNSTRPCGCDRGAGHLCDQHSGLAQAGLQIFPFEPDRMPPYVIKDSGKRASFAGGMVRDVEEGKTDYSLVLDGPMFERWAVHLTKGAVKYAARNWMLAGGQTEQERFKRSALRHFIQWFRGDTDEDHAAAVMFNINGAEYVKGKL